MFGTTGQPSNGRQQGSPFFDPHSGFSFFFNGMPFQNTWSRPGQINYRSYYKAVLPESYEKPYLIEIISDWCFACEWKTFNPLHLNSNQQNFLLPDETYRSWELSSWLIDELGEGVKEKVVPVEIWATRSDHADTTTTLRAATTQATSHW